jgi:hypothetical protein
VLSCSLLLTTGSMLPPAHLLVFSSFLRLTDWLSPAPFFAPTSVLLLPLNHPLVLSCSLLLTHWMSPATPLLTYWFSPASFCSPTGAFLLPPAHPLVSLCSQTVTFCFLPAFFQLTSCSPTCTASFLLPLVSSFLSSTSFFHPRPGGSRIIDTASVNCRGPGPGFWPNE